VEPEFSDEGDIFSLRYLGKRFSLNIIFVVVEQYCAIMVLIIQTSFKTKQGH
jgi:hypothetical protein